MELYAGKHATDAYALAGYTVSPRYGASNARALACNPEIKALIAEHFSDEWGMAAIQAARARRERAILAYSNIADFWEPSLDADGNPTGRIKIKDITKLPREFTAALRSIKPTKLGWEITLHDKDSSLRAIEERVDPVANKTQRMEVTGAGGAPLLSGSLERIANLIEQIAGREAGEPPAAEAPSGS